MPIALFSVYSTYTINQGVTSLKKAGDCRLIVMTMDGTVTCLTYP